jgi:RND family efflux transporter MFP subunit
VTRSSLTGNGARCGSQSRAPLLQRSLLKFRTALVGLAAALVLAATGTACKKAVGDEASKDSAAAPAPVAVAKVTRADLAREVVFDAEFRPFQDIDLHAKVAGFVQTMNVDVGDRVKAGQLLASIEVPELKEDIERAAAAVKRAQSDVVKAQEDALRAEEDIRRAEAEIKRAQAAHAEVKQTLGRIAGVAKERPGLVAQQEIDTAQSKERTADAQVAAAQAAHSGSRAAASSARAAIASAKEQVHVAEADLHKLQAKAAFTKIVAPFDGIISKRYADAGDMVRGGLSPSAPAVPLVRLVHQDKLRLVFPVSASFVAKVKPGDEVEVRVASLGKTIPGKVSRITREVEANTRTMETQVDVVNADGSLYPGMYAAVAMKLDRKQNALAVPLTALARGKKVTVFLIKPDNTLEEREVKLGLEAPDKAEVLAGLAEGDSVLVGSRSQVKPGQKVEPKLVKLEEAP